jgi:hypothetical protein
MEGTCSTGQSPQWAVVPVEEEEEEEDLNIMSLYGCKFVCVQATKAHIGSRSISAHY